MIGDGVLQQTVVEVLKRYRQEWLDLAQEGAKLGRKWTDILSPSVSDTGKELIHAAI